MTWGMKFILWAGWLYKRAEISEELPRCYQMAGWTTVDKNRRLRGRAGVDENWRVRGWSDVNEDWKRAVVIPAWER